MSGCRYRCIDTRISSPHPLQPTTSVGGVQSGALVRVRRGVYAPGESWRSALPEEVVVTRARALQLVSSRRLVFSHETAAAIHGLPLYRPDLLRSHVTLPASRPGATTATVRHRGDLQDVEIREVDGLLCTDLVRTVADMSRRAGFEQAVVVADAALRRLCHHGRRGYDARRAQEITDEVIACTRRSAHGAARAARVMRFADGRAELPGESISRIRLRELGFREVRLQVEVPGPGTTYFVDFGLEDADAFGEFDGRGKYLDPHLTHGLSSAEVLDREKQREDWIRGTTHRRMARWGWSHLATAAQLGARLAAFGIRA